MGKAHRQITIKRAEKRLTADRDGDTLIAREQAERHIRHTSLRHGIGQRDLRLGLAIHHFGIERKWTVVTMAA